MRFKFFTVFGAESWCSSYSKSQSLHIQKYGKVRNTACLSPYLFKNEYEQEKVLSGSRCNTQAKFNTPVPLGFFNHTPDHLENWPSESNTHPKSFFCTVLLKNMTSNLAHGKMQNINYITQCICMFRLVLSKFNSHLFLAFERS